MLGILSCKKKFNLFAVMLVLCFTASPDSFPLLENSKIAYLGLSFLVGALIYLNIDAVICHVRPIMLALTLLCIFFFGDAVYNFLSLILFAVFTVWLSFHATVKLPRLDKYGDFSYGLYLYAFPAQQICISVLGPENPYLIVASSFSASILLAALSWFLVERPSIKLKNKLLSFIARKYK